MDQETLLDLNEAVQYTGKSIKTLRRLATKEILPSTRGQWDKLLFRRGDLDKLMAVQYPEGMTHNDIATRYGVTRTLVIYHFQRLKVQAMGNNRWGGRVYKESTVAKFARILGWQEKPLAAPAPQSPPHGSLDRAHASPADD